MHKTRALFIGSNPSTASANLMAFDVSTKSGRTLHDWISKAEINISVLCNIADWATKNNRPLTTKEIKGCLNRLRLTLHNHQGMPVVAVGKTAAKALTMIGVQFFEIPHPSGLNRKLNDTTYVDQMIEDLKAYVQK